MVPVSAAWLRASFGWLFPFLLGRAFIEAAAGTFDDSILTLFPFLLGRAFIEAKGAANGLKDAVKISLPFGKGFH